MTDVREHVGSRLVPAGLLFGYRPRDIWEMRVGDWLRFADYIDSYREAQAKAR